MGPIKVGTGTGPVVCTEGPIRWLSHTGVLQEIFLRVPFECMSSLCIVQKSWTKDVVLVAIRCQMYRVDRFFKSLFYLLNGLAGPSRRGCVDYLREVRELNSEEGISIKPLVDKTFQKGGVVAALELVLKDQNVSKIVGETLRKKMSAEVLARALGMIQIKKLNSDQRDGIVRNPRVPRPIQQMMNKVVSIPFLVEQRISPEEIGRIMTAIAEVLGREGNPQEIWGEIGRKEREHLNDAGVNRLIGIYYTWSKISIDKGVQCIHNALIQIRNVCPSFQKIRPKSLLDLNCEVYALKEKIIKSLSCVDVPTLHSLAKGMNLVPKYFQNLFVLAQQHKLYESEEQELPKIWLIKDPLYKHMVVLADLIFNCVQLEKMDTAGVVLQSIQEPICRAGSTLSPIEKKWRACSKLIEEKKFKELFSLVNAKNFDKTNVQLIKARIHLKRVRVTEKLTEIKESIEFIKQLDKGISEWHIPEWHIPEWRKKEFLFDIVDCLIDRKLMDLAEEAVESIVCEGGTTVRKERLFGTRLL